MLNWDLSLVYVRKYDVFDGKQWILGPRFGICHENYEKFSKKYLIVLLEKSNIIMIISLLLWICGMCLQEPCVDSKVIACNELIAPGFVYGL